MTVERSDYLLDTNAISEWFKPRPNPGLMRWLDEVDEDRLYLSVISIGEIRRGIDLLADGRRKTQLSEWLSGEIIVRLGHRLLPVDRAIAEAWGRMRARADGAGKCVAPVDSLIAATAESRGLTVVTRNRKDFVATGVPMVCPWNE